jgi:RNA polymerase sigma-70 factor (ECF subfamily)
MDPQRALAAALMARAAKGDRQAFGELVDLVGPMVHRFCLAHLPPGLRDSAGDAGQECLLRAFQGRRRFRPGGDAVAWLLGIAMNVVRERRRKFRPGPSLSGLDPPARPAEDVPEHLADLAGALERLPARQREAVVCRFLRSMSVAQTARAMGCAEGTVKATVFKAMANLRRQLTDAGGAGAGE